MYSLQSSLEAAKADAEARDGELSALGAALTSRDSEAQALCLELKRHSELLAGLKAQLATSQAALTAFQHDAAVSTVSSVWLLDSHGRRVPVHRHEDMLLSQEARSQAATAEAEQGSMAADLRTAHAQLRRTEQELEGCSIMV